MTLPGPLSLIRHLWRHHYLIGQLVRREVLLKYRGSYLGIGWSFLYPLILLAAYTLVFGNILGARWGNARNGLELTLFIYCGLLVFTPFMEVLNSAPRLLHGHQNYVKKIIFPTEILPLVSVLAATAHGLVNVLLLVVVSLLAGHAHPSLLLIPLALLPAWLFTLGLAWMLAAAGAFIRDLVHVMPVFAQLLLFLSPVFYPLDAAPGALRGFHRFNPLAIAIEDVRRTALEGLPLLGSNWLFMLSVGLITALLGHAIFQRLREDFADVL